MECPFETDKNRASPVTPVLTKNNRIREVVPNKTSIITTESASKHALLSTANQQQDDPSTHNQENNFRCNPTKKQIYVGRKNNIPSLLQRHSKFPSQEDSVFDHPSNAVASTKNGSNINVNCESIKVNGAGVSASSQFGLQNDLVCVAHSSAHNGEDASVNKLSTSVSEILTSNDGRQKSSLKSNMPIIPSSPSGSAKKSFELLSQNKYSAISSVTQKLPNLPSINQTCPFSPNTSSSFHVSRSTVSLIYNQN